MILTGHIFEYVNLVNFLKTYNGKLFFKEFDKIWCRKGDKVEVFCTNIHGEYKISHYIAGLGGLWIVYNPDKEDENYRYVQMIDMKGRRKKIHQFKGGLNIEAFLDNKCFYLSYEEETYKTSLCKVDFDTFDRLEPTSKMIEIGKLVVENRIIYTRTRRGKINCIDEDLNIIWSKTFENYVRHRGNLDPMIFENSVILNLGVNSQTERDCEIVSLNKENGEIIWRKVFKKEISNCLLINNRLLVAHQGRLIIIDPENGDVLVDKASGFEMRTHEDTLWADDNYLYYISCGEAAIRIFSYDGKKVLQDLQIPDPFEPVVGNALTIYRNSYYLPLALRDMCLNGSFYGLLGLSPAKEGDKLEITIEPRPEYEVLTKQTNDGQDFCHVILENEDLEKILKYAPIAMKEYASVKGAQVWSDDRRNPKFNGLILFDTNLDDFNDDDQAKINQMITDTERYFETMNIRAGNRKEKIRIELRSSTDKNDKVSP